MNREKRFQEITNQMLELYKKKNADYGNSFERAWKKFGVTVGLVYMDAKINRAYQLITHPNSRQILSERVEDTLIDLANYSIMTSVELQKYRGVVNPTFESSIKFILRDDDMIIERWHNENPRDLLDKLSNLFEVERQKLTSDSVWTQDPDKLLELAVAAITINILLEGPEGRQSEETESASPEKPKEPNLAPQEIAYLCKRIPVKITLEEGGIMPKKATDGSAGYDLFAPCNTLINPGRNVVPLNFRMALPEGVGATPNSRSGFTLKGFEGYRSWRANIQSGTTGYPSSTGWTEYEPIGEPERMNADVQWGLIDMDYRGVCGVLVISHESEPFLLAKGTRFAQMCFQDYEEVDFAEVDKLDETTRGDGGFNSTGTK